MSALLDIIKTFLGIKREKELDARDKTRVLAAELDSLADLFENVLESTDTTGHIDQSRIGDLERQRKRNWDSWVNILGTSGFISQDQKIQAEIQNCIKIAHAAPGAYVNEILLVQIGLSEGTIPLDVRNNFANSIDRIRNLTAAMRLNS